MELQLISFVTLLVVNFALGTKDIAREKKEITYKASYLKTEQGLAQNLPVCADSEDSRFCNCFAQKSIGHCESKRNDMQYWCPITCKLCTGLPKEDVGKVIVARRAPSPANPAGTSSVPSPNISWTTPGADLSIGGRGMWSGRARQRT